MNKLIICAVMLTLPGAAIAGGRSMAPFRPIHPTVRPFNLDEVRLLPSHEYREMEADKRYLLSLSTQRLLRNFRVTAGLPAPGKPLGGWEAPTCEVRGHFVGHFMSACALMYNSTGDPRLKERGEEIVKGLAQCQRAMGTGYLSAFPVSYFDRLDSGKQVWAPYYTIHKIMQGLLDMYQLCGDKLALQVDQKMADYFWNRDRGYSYKKMQMILQTEFGGMQDTLIHLYEVTHKPEDYKLAFMFQKHVFDGPLKLKHDDLTNIHANTHIPQALGAARRYELTGDTAYRTLVSYFWQRVADHRSYATGGSNLGEFWGPPNKLAYTLAANNQETCTTYNILKVTRDLFEWDPKPSYADFYERAYFNGILPAQNPKTGMMIYYTPLAAGFTKNFGTPNNTFWCCYGTGVESFAKLSDSIYFHNRSELYVNLYVPSVLNWHDKGLILKQETEFPKSHDSRFHLQLKAPAHLTLQFHIPYWAGAGREVAVNGKPVGTNMKTSSFYTITRTWHNGDTIDVRLPMYLHLSPMPDNSDMNAIMYGPLVLGGILQSSVQSGIIPGLGQPHSVLHGAETLDCVRQDILNHIKPVANEPLHFETVGFKKNYSLVPLYDIIHQVSTVYWYATGGDTSYQQRESETAQQNRALVARIQDYVLPGNSQSEALHGVQSSSSGTGNFAGTTWRDADGGWFSYQLATKGAKSASLLCSYWGSDSGNRTFDILVNGTKIATQTLQNDDPTKFFTVTYVIPPALLNSGDTVRVEFRAAAGKVAGGLFGVALLKG